MREVLEAYFLRPDAALVRSAEIHALKTLGFAFTGCSMDLGGGDGIFSFLYCGGKLHPDYDLHREASLDPSKAGNIYDFTQELGDIRVVERAALNCPFTNLDISQALLARSRRLNMYKNYIKHDISKANSFDDHKYDCIFSTILMYFDNPRLALENIKRKLRKGGVMTCCVPLPRYANNTFPCKYSNLPEIQRFVELIDAGRTARRKRIWAIDEWIDHFESVGFSVSSYQTYLSDEAVQMLELSTRLASPALIKIYNEQSIENRREHKMSLVDAISPVLSAFLEAESTLSARQGGNYVAFMCVAN